MPPRGAAPRGAAPAGAPGKDGSANRAGAFPFRSASSQRAAFAKVPRQLPAAGCVTMPWALLKTNTRSSS